MQKYRQSLNLLTRKGLLFFLWHFKVWRNVHKFHFIKIVITDTFCYRTGFIEWSD